MKLKFTRRSHLLLSLCFAIQAYAQIQDSFSLAYSKLPNTLFQSFFLHDQSSVYQVFGNYYKLSEYDGAIPAAELRFNDFQMLYADLWLSQRLDSAGNRPGGKPPHMVDWGSIIPIDRVQQTKTDCPIHLLWMSYNELDSNALYEGQLYYDGVYWQVPDSIVNLDPQGNYSLNRSNVYSAAAQSVHRKEAFLAGTNVSTFYVDQGTANIDFQIPSSLIQKNVGTISAYWADFDDGNGFIQVHPDQNYSVYYSVSSASAECSTKYIRIRARIGQQWRESKFRVNVVFNSTPSDTVISSIDLPQPLCSSGKAELPARITIDYANNNDSLTKPIVIVEGFEGAATPYGYLNYKAVRSGYIFDSNGDRIYEHMAPLSWLMDSLNAAGFDLVYLDFCESKLPVQQNAATLLHLLQWIDAQQPNNATTVVGASLGGLITRYALLQAEEMDCCLNVAAYGTFDSPHDGAFIPIGLQATTESLARLFPSIPLVANPWKITLGSTAARQMLVTHYDSNAANTRSEFIDDLGEEHPTNLYRFAISNGSIHGQHSGLADSVARYLSYGWSNDIPVGHRIGANQDTLLFNRTGKIRNVQIVGTRSEGHRGLQSTVFEGSKLLNTYRYQRMRWISISNACKAQWIYSLGNIATFIPSSVVNGAVEAVQTTTNTQLQNLALRAAQQGRKVKKSNFPLGYDEIPGSLTDTPSAFKYPFISVHSPDHCFIPSFSALDAGNKYDTLAIPTNKGMIPFHSIYAPGLTDSVNYNQRHIETTPEIIHYLLEQFNGIYRSVPAVIVDTFNIAQQHNLQSSYVHQLSQTSIAVNGCLRLGHKGPIGLMTSTVQADTIQSINVSLKNGCNEGQLDVYGRLEIGQSIKRTAELRIPRGTAIVIHSNAEILIGPGSAIIIEEGGRMIIGKGANIHLNRGTIMAQGSIELEQGTNFKPLGSGTIVFDNGVNCVFQSENKVVIENHKVVVKTQLSLPSHLDIFIINRCNVELTAGGAINCSSSIELLKSTFNQSLQKQWCGLRTMGPSTLVDRCSFIGGSPALQVSSSMKASIERSTFSNCIVGTTILKRIDGFKSNHFERCQLGANVQVKQFSLSSCRFENCYDGLLINGISGEFKLANCVFTSNQHIAVEARGMRSRLTCNTFVNNGDAFVSEYGTMQLGRNAGNTFKSNFTAIRASECKGLELAQGHNTFLSNHGYDLLCSFDSTAMLTKAGAFYQISANYNSFSTPSSSYLIKGRTPVHLMYNPQLVVSQRLCPESSITSIDSNTTLATVASELLVWPNPSTDGKGLVKLPHSEGGTLHVLNQLGQTFQTLNVASGTREMDIDAGTARGMVILRFESKQVIATYRWVLP